MLIALASLGGFFFCSADNDQLKENIYNMYLWGPETPQGHVFKNRLKKYYENIENVRSLLRDNASEVLFPGMSKKLQEDDDEDISDKATKNQKQDEHVLETLWKECKNNADFRPFIKKGYMNFKKAYKTDPTNLSTDFPDSATIDTYPEGYDECASKQIFFGLLLREPKITRKEYRKLCDEHSALINKPINFLKNNRSEILFPGTSKAFDREIDIPELAKLDKIRDEKLLENFWKECIHNPDLKDFIEIGHANFTKTYGTQPPVRSIVLNDGSTLGSYIDSDKDSYLSELCSKLEKTKEPVTPQPSSTRSIFKKIFIVGVIGAITYIVYVKYKAHQKNKLGDHTMAKAA